MSGFQSSPINIPKKRSKSKFSFNYPPSDSSSYYFELELDLNNSKKKMFRKIVDRKYCHLVELDDKIDYNNIKKFKITILKIPQRDSGISIMQDTIKDSESNYSKKENDIYIEFTKNNVGFTVCTCYFVGVDFTNTFISPPN
jgi:hypothetical protein